MNAQDKIKLEEAISYFKNMVAPPVEQEIKLEIEDIEVIEEMRTADTKPKVMATWKPLWPAPARLMKPFYSPQPQYRGAYGGYVEGKLQPKPESRKNRFPKIFDSAKKLKPDAKRVLSFGCATGQEVTSLGERFPDAELIGVDIDHHSILQARRDNKLPNAYFHDTLGGLGKFDVVTCLMVLFCMDKPVDKKLWTDTLVLLDKHVNDDGFLLIYTSEFDPIEVLGDKYEAVNVWSHTHNKNGKDYFDGYYRKKPTKKWFSWLKSKK